MNVENGIQLSDLAGIARRRGYVAGLTALVVVGISFVIAASLPNVYTSYATVLVEPQSVAEDLVKAGVADSDLNQRLHLMTAQILSRGRLSGIIDEFGLYEDESDYMLREEIIDLMRERVSVEPVIPDMQQAQMRRFEMEINEFRIVFEDYDRVVARDVAQKLANNFIENHISERVRVSQKSLEFIETELRRLADRIGAVEGEIARVKNENPGSRPEDLAANQRRLDRLMGALGGAQREYNTALSDLEFYRSQMRTAGMLGLPGDDTSPARRLEIKKLLLAEFESLKYTDKHPDIIQVQTEIAALAAMVEAGVQEEGEEGTGSPLQQQMQAEVRRVEARTESARAEVVRINDLATEIEELVLATPRVAEQLDALMREYEHLRRSFQDFSNRHLEATVQAQLERRQLGEQFRVLEAAFVAPEASAPNRPLILAIGALLGIVSGLALAVLAEAADSSAHDARSLQQRFQLPVLVAIPRIWLESDRIAQRRKRIRTGLATAGLALFFLVTGTVNYLWVNGLPFSLEEVTGEEVESGGAEEATEG